MANKILAKNKVKIVLLCGPSCAGKTTSAKLLKQILELKGRVVDVISMDDFFIDLDKRKPLPDGKPDFDSPDILDYELMNDCFSRYFAGEDVYFPQYDFTNSKSVPNAKLHKYNPNSIIIFEGIHVLNPRVLKSVGTANYFRIFVSPLESFKNDKTVITTKNLRLLRRVIRDTQRRNTPAKKTIEMWPGVVDVEEKYIEPFRNKVDYYVNTTHEYELGVFKVEVEKFIAEGKLAREDVPFIEFLDYVLPIDKKDIPDTSLMWEFVDK
jgi:uridine kinase